MRDIQGGPGWAAFFCGHVLIVQFNNFRAINPEPHAASFGQNPHPQTKPADRHSVVLCGGHCEHRRVLVHPEQLTTNVTGHFALFVYDLAHLQFWRGLVYFLYILSFLLGAFSSGVFIELFRHDRRKTALVAPIFLEMFLLAAIPLLCAIGWLTPGHLMACVLLYAMGLQNSYVTRISNTVVRTTHLTGLFTDLGLELSQLMHTAPSPERTRLRTMIHLRVYIISGFFAGGLFGGFVYSELGFDIRTLYFASFILLIVLFYDRWRFWLLKQLRK